MDNSKFEVKDLITVGVFTCIYFFLFFVSGMIGFIPVLLVLRPLIRSIVCGMPFMLFLTRINRFGMVTIMGTVLGGLLMLMGYSYVLLTGFLCGIVADFILLFGKYQSTKMSVLGYGFFSLWELGLLAPFWIARDSFEKLMVNSKGGAEYAQTVLYLFDKLAWAFPLMAFTGGILGAFIGLKMLKKHFQKAGIA
jgi:energy-coupling factor transport system substrate-specific component